MSYLLAPPCPSFSRFHVLAFSSSLSDLLAPPCPTADTMNSFCVKTRPHLPLELLIFTQVTHKGVIVSEVGHSGRRSAERDGNVGRGRARRARGPGRGRARRARGRGSGRGVAVRKRGMPGAATQRTATQRTATGAPPRRAPSPPAYFCEPASSACTK